MTSFKSSGNIQKKEGAIIFSLVYSLRHDLTIQNFCFHLNGFSQCPSLKHVELS